MKSVFSDTTKLNRTTADIEQELSILCGGEILRWAIIDVTADKYVISYSYKK